MPRDGSDTRDRLLRAAEYLFARSGIDVPIREIHERAGQRNASATQYHFGSKQDLVRAVIDRHALSDTEIAAIRADLRARRDDPRGLVEAIVRRIAGYLATPEERDYVRIVFQLLFRAPIRSDLDAEIDRPDLICFEAEIDVIRSAVPYLSKRVMHERALAGLTFITLQVAERARIIDDEPGEPPLDEEAFIANLVDMTTALPHRTRVRRAERSSLDRVPGGRDVVGAHHRVGAAVAEHHRPAEEARVGPEQELDERGDLLRLPAAADRHGEPLDERPDERVVEPLLQQRRLHRAGRDRVEPDVGAGPLRPWVRDGGSSAPARAW